MTHRDDALLRCRIQNQRRELRKLNKHITYLNQVLQLSNHRAAHMYLLYSQIVNRQYRTRAWRVYVWWRNQIVWRVGQLMPNWRGYWNARTWYNKGVYDAQHYFGAPRNPKFPEE